MNNDKSSRSCQCWSGDQLTIIWDYKKAKEKKYMSKDRGSKGKKIIIKEEEEKS